ncbi:MAG TPA: lantibiotic dehydratase C-terminal domain-containing protein, partial [Ktedonobacteraceae bacterium]|nr:lantibiotic dehydratase C-terminal domain-containing protein [Ktedonobacteraceae bacterium]
ELLRPREDFLGEIGRQVRQLAAEDRLWVSETSLLSSIAHMHVNRLLGLDHDRERQVYAFWRHTLDSLVRRPDSSHFHHS